MSFEKKDEMKRWVEVEKDEMKKRWSGVKKDEKKRWLGVEKDEFGIEIHHGSAYGPTCYLKLSWSESHGLTLFVELEWWFSKELTASCSALGTKWRQHPSELKAYRSLSCAWNHQICSAAWMIFKGTYSFT